MGELTFSRNEINWYFSTDRCWYIQKIRHIFGREASEPKHHLQHTGCGTDSDEQEGLLHSGGNDAAWKLHAMLANVLMTSAQFAEFGGDPVLGPIHAPFTMDYNRNLLLPG
ncbi:hypothetical protein OCU04_003185 [Sclerotinia nivalis]|uniref:Uncharacterized protein n=1 Tax=Sclerotinia nivalis TaxID=352851 RepID=A0A9X0AVL9_9HELO|nr:hypothetical protein OCU04_003185 [Sclerotinia nivalis]